MKFDLKIPCGYKAPRKGMQWKYKNGKYIEVPIIRSVRVKEVKL